MGLVTASDGSIISSASWRVVLLRAGRNFTQQQLVAVKNMKSALKKTSILRQGRMTLFLLPFRAEKVR
jgi:hypothetical protein